MDKKLNFKKSRYKIEKEDLSTNDIKKHKAFGALKKYAKPSIIGHERELLGEAIAEEYIKKYFS